MAEEAALRVCVFCGSSPGSNPIYVQVAYELGRKIAERGWTLIYGGGNSGVMGAVARGVREHGGKVVSIIPTSLIFKEAGDPEDERTIVVETMHERKALMSEHSDACITLPGGFGTLDELFEFTTWQQIGIHEKKMGILNVAGFYDPLLQMIDRAVEEGFIKSEARKILVVGTTADEILDLVKQQEPPKSEITWKSSPYTHARRIPQEFFQ